MTPHVNVRFPEWSQGLFKPARYKVAHGGRGSGKSWAYARALIIAALKGDERILCVREVQKSIKDSVHRLLCDQIEAMGIGSYFDILETAIRSKTGSEILFCGLSSVTADSIKSYEGVTKVWAEEAQVISKRSWDILIPTIRKENSEIWITFNPVLDSDETWLRFVANPPPNSWVKQVNYNDNPWFPQVLEQEREHCRITSPEDYKNIWEGKCRSAVEGAIYAGEVTDLVANSRICNVPYDPRLKAHAVWDLGWNDSMSIAIVQRGVAELRVIDYIEESHKTLDYYVSLLKSMPLNWGYDFLPHDGRTRDFKTGKSTEEILQAFGRNVRITPSVSVENGIKAARMELKRTYFDKDKTKRLVECLKRYRRAINQATNEAGAPVHDEFSHGADVFRYLALNVESMTNEDERIAPQVTFHTTDIGY
jgi:phage terminase large subunit